ncbi:MAG: hypothetical protein RR909_03885 [Bacilli bacterium]
MNEKIKNVQLQVVHENYKLYWKQLFVAVVYFIFALAITSLFSLLTVFSSVINYSLIGMALLSVLSTIFLLYPSVYGLYGVIYESYGDLFEKNDVSATKVFLTYMKMAYFKPFKGQLKIIFVLLIEILVYSLFSGAIITFATNIIANVDVNVFNFLTDFKNLVSSGASTAELFSFYLNNGEAYDNALKIINVIVTSVAVMSFLFVITYRLYYLALALMFSPYYLISPLEMKMNIKNMIRKYRGTFLKQYFTTNRPCLALFLTIYIGSIIILTFYSSNFVFIVIASLMLAFAASSFLLPIIGYNSLITIDANIEDISKILNIDGSKFDELLKNIHEQDGSELTDEMKEIINSNIEPNDKENSNEKKNDDQVTEEKDDDNKVL